MVSATHDRPRPTSLRQSPRKQFVATRRQDRLGINLLLRLRVATSLTTSKSKFGLGQDAAGHDVFIKITDQGSDEHRINQYLINLDGAAKQAHCPYALRPVAVLDSPHNFSFIVMPW